jgi:hypothetical protein
LVGIESAIQELNATTGHQKQQLVSMNGTMQELQEFRRQTKEKRELKARKQAQLEVDRIRAEPQRIALERMMYGF